MCCLLCSETCGSSDPQYISPSNLGTTFLVLGAVLDLQLLLGTWMVSVLGGGVASSTSSPAAHLRLLHVTLMTCITVVENHRAKGSAAWGECNLLPLGGDEIIMPPLTFQAIGF